MELSVVIICKNEQKNIERCILSIFNAIAACKIKTSEIIIVDSKSSDDTLKIAITTLNDYRQNPQSNSANSNGVDYKIIQIKKCLYSTAAMGRNIGAINSKYKYILFIDADMEINNRWLKIAMDKIEQRKDEIGIVGDRDDIYVKKNQIEGKCINYFNIKRESICKTFGGAILIKKQELLDCGNYDLDIKVNEEIELYSRIKKHKYKLIEIPDKMINHYTEYMTLKDKIIKVLNTDMKNGRSLAFKKAFKSKNVFNFIMLYKLFFLTIINDIVSLIILILLILNKNISGLVLLILIQLNLMFIYQKTYKIKHYIIDKILAFKFLKAFFYKHKRNNFSYEIIRKS